MSSRKSKLFFLIVLALTTFVVYQIFKPYFTLLAISLITVALYYPLYNLILKLTKRKSFATGVSTIAVLLTFIIPLSLVLNLTINQSKKFAKDLQAVISGEDVNLEKEIDKANEIADKIPYVDIDITEDNVKETLSKYTSPAVNFLVDNSVNVGVVIADSVTKFFLYLIIISGLFPIFPKMISFIKKLSPMDNKTDEILLSRVISMSKAMVKGSFVIACTQGIWSALILSFAGMPYTVFWAILLTFLSIIPLGAGIIAVPIGIIYILIGQPIWGIIIIINHFLIVTNIDNILRPRLVSKDAELHPILVLISVLGGIKVFGFFGFIFGPVVMIFFVTLLEVYLKYIGDSKK